jgi:hypothetical protein
MKSHATAGDVTRRTMLKGLAAAGLWSVLPGESSGEAAGPPVWAGATLKYLEGLRRPDGGYAWEDQPDSHLTPTFAAIGCYHALRQDPPQRKALAEFVRTHHPFAIKKLERDLRMFEYQQIQGLVWLGEDASDFAARVRTWTRPSAYPTVYERHGYPVFQLEITAFTCRELLGLPTGDLAPQFVEYVVGRRRANGSFNNTPASDGGDGHVMNTWWGLEALRAVGRSGEKRQETVAWLQACQRPGGGFTYRPNADAGGVDDAAYTWAAARALKHLGAAPADREACVRYLYSLRGADGGFADRPGWASNAVATYYALDALEALGALASAPAASAAPAAAPRPAPLPGDLKVFTIQIEAHGHGSPAEAVELARALRVHLWGAKNAEAGWIARAQAIADRRKVPVRFFVANEEYGTFVTVPGLGTYSHTSDVAAPAGADFGPSLAGPEAVSWEDFRTRRLAPLQKAGGRLVWQFGENEELVRIYLDDSVERGGYAAISTFHFGNPDFTNSEPFLYRWRHRLAMVALQDAHGGEPWWWGDMTAGFRTLFLAAEPTWAAWLDALKRDWVVAVRRDAVTGQRLRMHGGAPGVQDFVREHQRQWQWWDNPDIQRPLASVVAVTPADQFEAARPQAGVTVRVRCQWDNTAQGLPKTPVAELVRLAVDGRRVQPSLVEKKNNKKQLSDHYYEFHIASPAAGRHTATATVRVIRTGAQADVTTEFTV